MRVVIDLFCGLGGWARGFMDAGYRLIGYDIEDYSETYPGQFIRADLFECESFPSADIIVASPPCTDFSKAGFPATWQSVKRFPPDVRKGMQLFRRAEEIISIVKPSYWVIENVGKAKTHYGSRYLWGHFPDFFCLTSGDQYGKWKLPPSPDRAVLRSIIPYSLSRGMAEAMKEATKQTIARQV